MTPQLPPLPPPAPPPATPPSPAPHRRRPLKPTLLLGVAFITATCIVAAVFAVIRHVHGPSDEGLRPLEKRKPALLAMPTLEGNNWSLADQAGKVVVINYFATWCVPCREEMPDLVAIANARAAGGLIVAAVSLDADESPERPRTAILHAYQAQNHLPFPILTPSLDSPLFATTVPLPQTVLVDRHGRTARRILGVFDPADLRESIDTLLKEP